MHQSIFKQSMNTKTYHGYIGSFGNYYFYSTNNCFNFSLFFCISLFRPFHFFLLLSVDYHNYSPYILIRDVGSGEASGAYAPPLLLAPTPQILGRCAAMIKDDTQLDTHISSAPLI